ncbi:hypothetical protein GT037_006146 [Alternaria burnsii]|uniref:Uncharacterized protein n=1 Tax=Alternaria burnsii TaxID=1187904 RepID=A0A8H7B4Y0_9PLEO|nr:uncharacterized protein GT037_006146 [Alternaria burnsii]KAF7675427.1 hypothetical protein GT037_006146 [Alternaria burnsii]
MFVTSIIPWNEAPSECETCLATLAGQICPSNRPTLSVVSPRLYQVLSRCMKLTRIVRGVSLGRKRRPIYGWQR